MPANLTPQYHAAEKVFREAKTTEEKIAALEEMLRLIPKHKGSEKLQADLKRRLSKLRREDQKTAGGKRAGRRIPRQGAGQVALIGAPNVGKSALLCALTQARAEVAPYPMTTFTPTPGMMPFEDVQMQLIDLPPLLADHVESWVFELIRPADLLLLLVDLTAVDPLRQVDGVCEQLAAKRIAVYGAPSCGGMGNGPEGEAEAPLGGVAKPTLLVGTKLDGAKAADNAEFLREYYAGRLPFVAVSIEEPPTLETFRRTVFTALRVLRIYTRAPGRKEERGAPYVLPRGSTVWEVANLVHKDVAANLKYARIWGARTYDGQRVMRDYVVQDGDLIELHVGGA